MKKKNRPLYLPYMRPDSTRSSPDNGLPSQDVLPMDADSILCERPDPPSCDNVRGGACGRGRRSKPTNGHQATCESHFHEKDVLISITSLSDCGTA